MVRVMSGMKKYYKDLDVIRNLSCVAVLLYHLGLLKGGYLAVCTFFVLSGYLSCQSFFRRSDASLWKYYQSRFFHIYVPLLIVVCVSIFAISLFPNINFLNLKPETTSVLFGYNNFWQLNANLDYFARHVNSPFMHFWYIGILLQFELVFPFIFLFLKKIEEKTKKKMVCIILGTITIISIIGFFISSLLLPIMVVYYHTFTRIFSILMGMFVSFLILYYGNIIPKIIIRKEWYRFIFYGYIIIFLLLLFFVDSQSKFFSIAMIIASIISCNFIRYGTLKPIQKLSIWDKFNKYFANISYEIYLVQYPIIFLFQYIKIVSWMKIPLIILFTLLLSIFLHFSLSIKKKDKYFIIKMFCCILILGISSIGFYQYILAKDHTQEMKDLELQLNQNQETMKKKQEEYALRLKEEQEKWEKTLSELQNDESKLVDAIHNLPVVGIGDSVMLGAVPNLYEQFPNGYFDAKVSRTDYEANGILQGIKNQNLLGEVILFNLGTNGQCGESCRNVILETAGDKKVFWINVTNDQDVHVNAGLQAHAEAHDNVYYIDWNAASNGHPEYFVADGIHLTDAGRKAYAETIFQSVYQVYYNEFHQKLEQAMKQYEDTISQKITFYGNDLLINSYDFIQAEFKDFDVSFHEIQDKELEQIISSLISDSSNNSFPKNHVFLFDTNTTLTKKQYQDLLKISDSINLYLVFLKSPSYSSSNHLYIYDFSNELLSHPNYLLADKVHLSKEGNKTLIQNLFHFIQK